MRGNEGGDRSRWQARPALARALSAAVFITPLAGSFLATRAVAPLLVGWSTPARVLVLGVFAVVVGVVAERALRRVLPLAALLRMTMLFPDRAPSRFKLARAAGNTSILEERARSRPGETAGEAATRILGLLATLGAHDRRTRGHSERVRVFTDVLAAELHLNQAARDRLRWAALLHDLGKVAVPAAVLNKPAVLDASEWDLIRQHPARGAVMAGPLLEWLGDWGAAIEQHHERFDGRGYPNGLAGHDIALAGRIVAVADSFEVMTAARSYKRPMSVRAARRELADVAGTQLDPACVRAFLGAALPRVLWAVGPLALVLNLPFLRGLAEVGKAVEQAGVTAAGQATTAAVAATTAAVVVASSGAGPAQAAGPTAPPRTTASQSSLSSQPATPSASGQASPTQTSSQASAQVSHGAVSHPAVSHPRPSGARSVAASSVPSQTPTPSPHEGKSSPSSTPVSTPAATASSSASATVSSSPSASATPSPTASPTPSSSSSTTAKKPPKPVIVSVSIQVPPLPVVVVFTDTDLTVTFKCRIDGKPWAVCTSPVSYAGLASGKHRVEVQAFGPTGLKSDVAGKDFTI